MKVIQGIEELRTYLGKEVGVSDWLTITQERVDEFARATGDNQWIHTDPVRAKAELPYGNTIAHGFLTLALAPRFSYDTYRIEGLKMTLNYGLNKVRFTSHVTTNSRVRMRVTLLALETTKGGFKTTTQVTFEVEGQHKPVCVAEALAVLYF
ncbi:MAG: MaoC family dehydratase [Ferruginibacter sp.]|nr:MaoC family dehydratase [Cytophagales bacterium]